jgi:hypothetical protein
LFDTIESICRCDLPQHAVQIQGDGNLLVERLVTPGATFLGTHG